MAPRTSAPTFTSSSSATLVTPRSARDRPEIGARSCQDHRPPLGRATLPRATGIGKSQMLTATSALAPRGVYVCGNTTSSSGLTVTVVKDQLTGDFVLEAGALVMGDQGCCCIDEFDKMNSTEHQARHSVPRLKLGLTSAVHLGHISAGAA